MSAVADVLNKAADLIERDGFVQRMPVHPVSGARCMNRATYEAARFNFGLYWSARAEVCAVVGATTPSYWNDIPGRTQAEVIAALRAAAERAA